MDKHFVNITKKLKLKALELKKRDLHCQKYWLVTNTTQALLKSSLK